MPRRTHFSNYKGYYITTRCAEAAPLPDARVKRFTAFFRIESPSPAEDSWHRFLAHDFHDRGLAQADALAAARRSIDLDLAVYQ